MITLLVTIHVLFMIVSLITTAGAALTAFAGHRVSGVIVATSAVTTALGVGCGIVLMVSLPLDLRCIVLISYVAAFMYAQVYVSRSNQLRSTSSDL